MLPPSNPPPMRSRPQCRRLVKQCRNNSSLRPPKADPPPEDKNRRRMTKSRRRNRLVGNSRPRYYSAMSPLNAPKDPNLLKNVEKFPSGRGYPTERLPTLKLKNEVIWTNQNKNLKSPFHLKKSQKDVDLGIFLKTNEYTTSEGDHALGVRWSHGRSADIGKVFFRDLSRPDLVYRDIDIKGAGYVTGSISPLGERLISKQWGPRKSEFGEYLGLLNKKAALHDSVTSEILTKRGMRTHRSIAIIK